ncbi:MAG: hypothetical protein CMO74_03785 [Verrucomicrobiales bacterium]|nr:hypothetical protein [Verrucomicrobiales bacterium]|tara:strand:+ start:27690 stop:28565 length:876 start_codon:yes stop_codon:yes gene_type:complete
MSRKRLQKKCFMVSLGMHLLLLLVVVFGVAFATTRKDEEPVKYISLTVAREEAPSAAPQQHQARRVVPPENIRRVTPPTPPRKVVEPPRKQVKTHTQRSVKTTPPKNPSPVKPKNTRKSTNAAKPKSQPKQQKSRPKVPKIKVNSKVFSNKGTASSQPKVNPARKAVNTVKVNPNAVNNLKSKLSSTLQAVVFRPGSSSYNNYKEWVRQKYQQTWNSGRLPGQRYRQVVTVKVTVSRSGQVLSSSIVRRSGQAPLDASVQGTLNVVRSIGRSFPAGVKESRQTFTIDFQMR